jgi:pSer/pThr/pTyr-binding forkhead associated (FHA) protein
VNSVILCHPSISKQHAVIQFRRVKGAIAPWLMDLESVNKTYLYSVEQVPHLLGLHVGSCWLPLRASAYLWAIRVSWGFH